MNPETEVTRLLKEHGAILKREKNHEVWQLPNGRNFIRAKTPSDANGPLNNLTDLRKALGIADPERGKPGERRQRKVTANPTVRQSLTAPTVSGSLQEKLRLTGLSEAALRAEIASLKSALTAASKSNCRKRVALAEACQERQRCWGCRTRKSRISKWLRRRVWLIKEWWRGASDEG